jgi:nitrate/nitrite transporter NarK
VNAFRGATLPPSDTRLPFIVGALGNAFSLGIGNGAVFKLVPPYFPKEVGTVADLVGAMGGLGGFFLLLPRGNESIRRLCCPKVCTTVGRALVVRTGGRRHSCHP